MKSKIKNRLVFFGILLTLLAVFAFWYKTTYSMEVVSSYETNSKDMPSKIVLATQGSFFKDAIVKRIVNNYKADSVYVYVVDVSELKTVSIDHYDAIVILHTWEYGKPPIVVNDFVNGHRLEMHKIIVMATSGAGNNKMEGIDAIVGESILENADDYTNMIIEKIEELIQNKNN